MGKFDLNLSDLVEGRVIKKSTLSDVYSQLNTSLDGGIGPDNIREEGLDRRSFKNLDGEHISIGQNCYLSSSSEISATGTTGNWSYGPIGGLTGSHGEYPRVDFEWDPEVHTYAVLRCSFFVSQQRNSQRFTGESAGGGIAFGHDGWDFGLRVSPNWGDGTLSPSAVGGVNLNEGSIFPYQRVCLNAAFSSLSESSGSDDEGGPMRHDFDRVSSMRQSVFLFAVFGVGDASSAYSDSIRKLNEPKTVRTDLVYRTKYGNYEYSVPDLPLKDHTSVHTERNRIEIDGLTMNVTMYRR